MNKRLKARFIKNLLSGKFPQTRASLKDRAGYCCLGVLRHTMNPKDRHSFDRLGTELAPCQLRRAGIRYYQHTEMIHFNDIKLWTFKQIAGWVKTNL